MRIHKGLFPPFLAINAVILTIFVFLFFRVNVIVVVVWSSCPASSCQLFPLNIDMFLSGGTGRCKMIDNSTTTIIQGQMCATGHAHRCTCGRHTCTACTWVAAAATPMAGTSIRSGINWIVEMMSV